MLQLIVYRIILNISKAFPFVSLRVYFVLFVVKENFYLTTKDTKDYTKDTKDF